MVVRTILILAPLSHGMSASLKHSTVALTILLVRVEEDMTRPTFRWPPRSRNDVTVGILAPRWVHQWSRSYSVVPASVLNVKHFLLVSLAPMQWR